MQKETVPCEGGRGGMVKGWRHRPTSSPRGPRPDDGASSSSALSRGLGKWGCVGQEPEYFPGRRGPHMGQKRGWTPRPRQGKRGSYSGPPGNPLYQAHFSDAHQLMTNALLP